MIYPASTFLLASLVVNAASVFGAPIRLPLSSQNVARDVIDDPVLVERTVKVDPVPNTWRSVDPDLDGRTTHSAREIAPENAIRNTAPSDEVEARNPLPEIERIVRRYPRQALYERHETRSPPSSPPVARSPTPETEAPPVERRFFRRALYERHQPRADPPAPPQAREAPPDEVVRRFPRKILAERYLENRSPEPAPEPALPPVVPELPVAREAEPELPKDRMVRRYARRAIAEQMEQLEARQDPPTPPAPASSEIPSGAPTLIPAPSSAVPSSSAPTSTATPIVPPNKDDNPVVAIINGPNKAANFVTPIPTGAVEIDRENEETVYHKKTTEHISQCDKQVTNNNGAQPVVPVPVASGVSSSVPIPSATTPIVPVVPGQPTVVPVAPGQPTVTPVVPAQGNTGTPPPSASDSKPPTGTEGATPSASASASALPIVPASGGVTDPLLNPAPADAQPSPAVTDTPTVSTTPPAEGGVTRRDGSNVTDPIVLRGRSSGSVWASYLKRSMKDN